MIINLMNLLPTAMLNSQPSTSSTQIAATNLTMLPQRAALNLQLLPLQRQFLPYSPLQQNPQRLLILPLLPPQR